VPIPSPVPGSPPLHGMVSTRRPLTWDSVRRFLMVCLAYDRSSGPSKDVCGKVGYSSKDVNEKLRLVVPSSLCPNCVSKSRGEGEGKLHPSFCRNPATQLGQSELRTTKRTTVNNFLAFSKLCFLRFYARKSSPITFDTLS